MVELIYKELSYKVQGAFFEVYKSLGTGHKVLIYEKALVAQLKELCLEVESQKRIPIHFRKQYLGVYVPDIVVDDSILIEVKSKPVMIQEDIRQFWHYLKVSKYKVGYLVNFGNHGRVHYLRRVYDLAREA